MKMVSKKDLIFISLIFVAVIIFSLFSGDAVNVNFGSDAMTVSSSGFDFTMAYADVASVELSTLPELGTMDKGTDTASVKNGNWNNAVWGDYHLCVIPTNESCIVVTLTDGRTVVFNYKEAENTADVFSVFQEKLAK